MKRALFKVGEVVTLNSEELQGEFVVLQVVQEYALVKEGFVQGKGFHYRLEGAYGSKGHNLWREIYLKKSYWEEFTLEEPPMSFAVLMDKMKNYKGVWK